MSINGSNSGGGGESSSSCGKVAAEMTKERGSGKQGQQRKGRAVEPSKEKRRRLS